MRTFHAFAWAFPAALGTGVLFAAAAIAGAAICDKTYYMQSGSLTVLAGPSPTALEVSSRATVDKFMNGLDVIYPDTEYEVVTRFEGNGACSEWKKANIDFATRRVGSDAFTNVTTNVNSIRLHLGRYVLDTAVNFEYWFGIADSVGTSARLIEAIGKLKDAQMPHVWYGTAIVVQTIKDRVTGVGKGSAYQFYRSLASHPDSATLQATLLNTWKNEKANDTQTVTFKVQMMKVLYDTIPPPVGVRNASKPKVSAFQASQSGNLVLIRPGEGKVAPEDALGLSNMMGHRIATLHPTGYLYQWNGRTASGAEAPTGVYFVQSGSRILGKFFYSR